MIQERNLYDYIQNVSVSCIALHSFVLGYHNVSIHRDSIFSVYPKFEYLFFVLPIIYHRKSLETFKTCTSIAKVLDKNKSVNIGLHDRAIKMVQQTYDGLNLAFSKNILTINKDLMTIDLLLPFEKRALPLIKDNRSIREIQKSALRMGNIFAKTDERTLQSVLNIRF